MGQPRTKACRKPLILVCVALSLYVPLFYIDWVIVDLFVVSKDEQQVRNGELRTPIDREHGLDEGLLTPLTLYAFVFAGRQHCCCHQDGKFEFR
jgi:hypothetical protein